jgi:hypothetical protein
MNRVEKLVTESAGAGHAPRPRQIDAIIARETRGTQSNPETPKTEDGQQAD